MTLDVTTFSHPEAGTLRLRIYLAGSASSSVAALSCLRSALNSHDYDLEVIDVSTSPERTLDDGVVVTPTIVRLHPSPQIILVGIATPEALRSRLIG